MPNVSDFVAIPDMETSSDDPMISKDLNGIITSWNDAAASVFRFTSQEAIGKHISIIIPAALINEEKSYAEQIKHGLDIKHYETIRQRKDRSNFAALVIIAPIKNAKANVTGISIIAKDITSRKSNDYQTSLLASIINSSEDAIISKNVKGIITSWNEGAEKLFGYKAVEAIDQHISLIIPAHKLDEEATIISKILKGEKIDHFETVRKCKDGSEKNVSITISPIKDRNNGIIGASKIARDITEKVEIERQQALFAKKLGELNDFKDDFMMMASHELKTPLTVIKTSLQILHECMASGHADIRLVDRSLHSVERLATLVSELMDVSKIQNGKIDLEISVFDLTKLLKEIIADKGPLVSQHSIILSHPDKLIEIKADRNKIRQVVDNILDNALKYSPDGSKVQVDLSVKETGVIVKVKDDGIGISKEYLDKIFTRFFRVGGISSTFSGTGIGLYISAEIVRHHGGRMWVESESNKGSAFYVEIPTRFSAAMSKAV